MELSTHIRASMIQESGRRLRRALDRDEADLEMGSLAVLYCSRLSRLVREGRRDGDAAVLIASQLSRALAATPPLPEDRAVRRDPPAPPRPLPSHADTVVRDPGGPWRTPTPLPVAPEADDEG
ncbi:hypothetical protein [Methylorubrum thiocyanatum]|uniref:hypothetical protein n=1 Tax=Methylorubrum thiocyanatum TaxID=47958 RepID=UPI003F7ED1CF